MKNRNKLSILLRSILFCTALFIIQSNAKSQDKDSVISLPEIRVTSTSSVTQKVSTAFAKAFPGAQNLKWYKLDKDYLAKFILKEMEHSSLYRQNGYMVYDISYGYQKNLPKDIEQLVLKNYNNYKVFRAINVRFQGRDVWVVKLEGMKKYLTVRVEDNEIEEVEEFDKAIE